MIGEEEAASAAAAAAAGDAHARPGDWICGSCSSTNFAVGFGYFCSAVLCSLAAGLGSCV